MEQGGTFRPCCRCGADIPLGLGGRAHIQTRNKKAKNKKKREKQTCNNGPLQEFGSMSLHLSVRSVCKVKRNRRSSERRLPRNRGILGEDSGFPSRTAQNARATPSAGQFRGPWPPKRNTRKLLFHPTRIGKSTFWIGRYNQGQNM